VAQHCNPIELSKTKQTSKQFITKVIMSDYSEQDDNGEADGLEYFEDDSFEEGVGELEHNERSNVQFIPRSLSTNDLSLIEDVIISAKDDLQIVGNIGGGENADSEGYACKVKYSRKSHKKSDFNQMLFNMGYGVVTKEGRRLAMALLEQSIQLTKSLALFNPALIDDFGSDLNGANAGNGFLETLVWHWTQHAENMRDEEFTILFTNQIIIKVSSHIFILKRACC